MRGNNSMKRGSVSRKKLTFSYFPFVCLRKDVSGREENWGNAWAPSSCLLQCRPSSLSSSLSAPHYFNYTCHLRSSHFTSLLGFLSLLTGTVNWACLSCWLGLDLGLKLWWGQILTRVNGESGAGEGGSDFGRKGCNELAAMQGYRNTAWFFPPLWGIHLNSCREGGRGEMGRRGKRCIDTKQMCWIPYFSLPHHPLNLFVCFTHFLPISIIFWRRLLSHVKYYGFR